MNILLIPSPNWEIFAALESLGGGLKMFFELQNQSNNNVCGFYLIWLLKCLLTNLSTLRVKKEILWTIQINLGKTPK
jgi:hypothetical protein